jgi:hypothetical protein
LRAQDTQNTPRDPRRGADLMSRQPNRLTKASAVVTQHQNRSCSRLPRRARRLQFLALSIALLINAPLFARTKTDVIVMNNGDHLTCEIKALDSGVLYVSLDYVQGTVSVDWSKVDHLESKQSFIVKVEDGSVYSGMLSSTQTAGHRPMDIRVYEKPEGGVVIVQPQLVQLTQTSDEFWHRFNGGINSGTTYSKGNQALQYQLNASVVYPRERWSAGATASSTLSSSTGSTVATRNNATFDVLRNLRWKNWFYTGLGSFLQSSTQDIQLQSNVSGGIGRYLKNTDRAVIALFGGLAYQNTRYTQDIEAQPSQNVVAAMVGTNIQVFKFNKTNLTLTANAFPALSEPGRVYFNTDVTWYWKIGHNITWNVTFYGNWDNQPPPHFAGSDYGTSSGIGWTFGNR